MIAKKYKAGEFTQAKKRSIYFPKNKRYIFEQAIAMSESINGRSFDETVQDALELWIDRNWSEYARRLKE